MKRIALSEVVLEVLCFPSFFGFVVRMNNFPR